MTNLVRGEGAAGALRAGMLLLVVLGVAGVALSLAYERHWLVSWQLAPWITIGIVMVGAAAIVVRVTAATVWLARTVAVLAIVSGAIGVWQHIDANYTAVMAAEEHADHGHSHSHGDEEAATGPTMGEVMSGAVGHAPVPSALAIVPVGLALALATIGLDRRREPSEG